jgi:hypothetical protein
MSLTKVIRNSSIKEFLLDEFGNPPIIQESVAMKAPPRTRNYALVGTAFDYLFRFHIADRFGVKQGSWVADVATKNYGRVLEEARRDVGGMVTRNYPIHALKLARLDELYRRGIIDTSPIKVGDVEDLETLIGVVPWKNFPKRWIGNSVHLNPTFGEWSELVGGADADLILNGTLIDIKTTQYLDFKQEYFHQLIGYAILAKQSGMVVSNIAVYFSRHGYLYILPCPEITSKFVNRFKDLIAHVPTS